MGGLLSSTLIALRLIRTLDVTIDLCCDMGRGKHSGKWHHTAESLLSKAFDGGWAAKIAYSIGLQGTVKTRLHELSLSGVALQVPPLRIGFASDFHVGPLTHPNVLRHAFKVLAASS